MGNINFKQIQQDIENDRNKFINTEITDVNNLETKFNTKLNEYKNAYSSYLNSRSNYSKYIHKPGYIYSAHGTILKENKPSISQCESLCSANQDCGGINYNSSNKLCELQKGLGELYNSDDNSNIASITKSTEYLLKMSKLNKELLDINQQIINKNSRLQPAFDYGMNSLYQNDKQLFDINEQLMQERERIRLAMMEYNDADAEYQNRSIDIDQHYAYYNIWFIITIVLICLLIKLMVFPGTKYDNFISNTKWSLIAIIIIVLTMYLNNPTIFAIWLLLICLVLAMKANLIPSL